MVNTRRTTLGPISTNRRVSMAGPMESSKSSSNNNSHGLAKSRRSTKGRKSMIPRMSGTSDFNSNDNSHSNNASSSGSGSGSGGTTRAAKSRHSVTPGKAMSTGRKSMGGGNHNYGRSPHHRPSSIPAPTTMRTDTRPISDKTYFNTCVRNLHSYLVQNNYEYPIKLKDLARPSAKDFHNIMIFLLSRIDVSFYNNHAKGASSGMASERGVNNQHKRKFEDDVTMMFKALGYPFNISKTALVAAGSPHTWPSLLLAITWLIELLTSMSDEFLYEDDILFLNQQIDNVDEDADYIFNDIAEAGEQTLEDNNTIMDDLMIVEQRIKTAIQIYVERSYGTFINADDELYQKMEDQLLEYIEKDHMMIEHAIERLTDENGVIVERITDVEKEFESLPSHETRLEGLANDLETFHDLVDQLNQHKNALSEKVQERNAELEIKKTELEKMEQRIQDLIEAIATQEYSKEDVYQLEREKAMLEESVAQTIRKREEQESLHLNKEIELKREFERLERFVAPYNEQIKEFPVGNNDDELVTQISIEKTLIDEKQQEMLLGKVDLKNKIIPLLQTMVQDYIDETTKLRSGLYELKDEQVKTEEEVMEQKDRVDVITESVRRAEETYLQEKDDHEASLSLKRQEVEALEEKVETLRDPSSVEAVMSKYQSQINDLSTLTKKHQEENLTRKQAVLGELNQALQICSEYKIYREKELTSLQKYLKGRQQLDIALSPEEGEILSS